MALDKERIATAERSMVALPKLYGSYPAQDHVESIQVSKKSSSTYLNQTPSNESGYDGMFSDDDGIFFKANECDKYDDYGFDLNIEQESLEWSFVSGNIDASSWDKFVFI